MKRTKRETQDQSRQRMTNDAGMYRTSPKKAKQLKNSDDMEASKDGKLFNADQHTRESRKWYHNDEEFQNGKHDHEIELQNNAHWWHDDRPIWDVQQRQCHGMQNTQNSISKSQEDIDT